jgi:hypothetical protein
MMVKPTSRAAAQRRLERVFAVFHVADDVLQHHDGVVHHQAHGQRQAQQRDVVEAVAEGPQQATAPNSDTGSDSVGMTVAMKRRRNRKITSTTSAW